MVRVLYNRRRDSAARGPGTAAGPMQPDRQLAGCGVGCCAVEGHQGRRRAGCDGDVRPPAVAPDRQDLDHVRPAVDGFFETNDVHGSWGSVRGSTCAIDSSVRRDGRKRSGVRSCTRGVRAREFSPIMARKKSARTESPQRFNDSSTGFPQPTGATPRLPLASRSRSVRMGLG